MGKGVFCISCDQFLAAPAGVRAARLGCRVVVYLLDGLIPADGQASGWGWMFLREFGIKFVAINAVSFISGGIGTIVWIVDLLWAFWDRNHQALHEKIMKTVVIDDRAYRRAAAEEQRPEF